MLTPLLRVLILPLLLLLALPALATQVPVKGATPGQWTQDWDAALALAKAKNLPLLVNFTGSDWCGWCKIMDRDVFAKEEWTKFAEQQVVLVHLDFPRNAELVPAEYKTRNDQLQERFGVEGYPTFVVLDSDGQTELGRLRAGRGKTPASFAQELRQVTRLRAAEVAKVVKTLGPTDGPAYQAALAKVRAEEKALKDWLATNPAQTDENTATFSKLTAAITAAEAAQAKLSLAYASKILPADTFKKYQGHRQSLAEAEKALQTWLETRPANNAENQAKFQAMQDTIAEWQQKLGALEGQHGI